MRAKAGRNIGRDAAKRREVVRREAMAGDRKVKKHLEKEEMERRDSNELRRGGQESKRGDDPIISNETGSLGIFATRNQILKTR